MVRRCFYSFHYSQDAWRAGQVRNIGKVEGNKPTSDNDWEEVKNGGDTAIKRWINSEMSGRTCTIVLVGAKTAGRQWINYEIEKSWKSEMGLTGIYIHGLQNQYKKTSSKGQNPFSKFTVGTKKSSLSSIVRCYNPLGRNSTEKHGWIRDNIEDIVEEAIEIRRDF